jgi:hypothetical protein
MYDGKIEIPGYFYKSFMLLFFVRKWEIHITFGHSKFLCVYLFLSGTFDNLFLVYCHSEYAMCLPLSIWNFW